MARVASPLRAFHTPDRRVSAPQHSHPSTPEHQRPKALPARPSLTPGRGCVSLRTSRRISEQPSSQRLRQRRVSHPSPCRASIHGDQTPSDSGTHQSLLSCPPNPSNTRGLLGKSPAADVSEKPIGSARPQKEGVPQNRSRQVAPPLKSRIPTSGDCPTSGIDVQIGAGAPQFTEEKAKLLRQKMREMESHHDTMYHSGLAARLA